MAETPDAHLGRTKRVNEEFVVEWDFVNDLGAGDTLSAVGSGSTVTAVQADTGTDVSATFLAGATKSGTKLLVQVQGGTLGKEYHVAFQAGTAAGDIFRRILRVPMAAS